jgi:hypothetical protein
MSTQLKDALFSIVEDNFDFFNGLVKAYDLENRCDSFVDFTLEIDNAYKTVFDLIYDADIDLDYSINDIGNYLDTHIFSFIEIIRAYPHNKNY